MKKEDYYYAKLDGVFFKGIGHNEKNEKDCKHCEARTKCLPFSKYYNACHAFKVDKLRKCRTDETFGN